MNENNDILINEKNMEVLVAKFIPTSQYFERSFDSLQRQIDGLKEGQSDLKRTIGQALCFFVAIALIAPKAYIVLSGLICFLIFVTGG
ncbi:MAG: hypothetical protein U9R29_09320 [Thermodesulfobacteriota bacterium]|nr:hypothetical protein [Thermodesulfobacteriota bacterium]